MMKTKQGAKEEGMALLQQVLDEFADVTDFINRNLGEVARNQLFEMSRLQIGMTAPDIVGTDVDGIEFDQFILLDGMGNTLATQVVPDMPDGAVQSVSFDVPGVRTVILELGGSGALTRVLYCPDRLLSPGGGGPVTVR